MKAWLILTIATLLLNAYSLDEILTQFAQAHPLVKSMQENSKALDSQHDALKLNDPAELSLSSGYARPKNGNNGYEYSISITQNLLLPNVKENLLKSDTLNIEAQKLLQESDLNTLANDISLLYHHSCIDKRLLESFNEELDDFRELYTKKLQAYKLDEISKKELLEFELEVSKLENEQQNLNLASKISNMKLESLANIGAITPLCSDLLPITKEVLLAQNISLKEQSLEKSIQALDYEAKRYSNNFDNISVGTSYDKELDTNRASLFVNIPLSFSKNSKNYQTSIHKKSATIYQKEYLHSSKNTTIAQLQQELTLSYNTLQNQLALTQKYSDSLLPLIKKSYEYAQSSAFEFIQAKREYLKMKRETFLEEKKYYQTLFALKSVIDAQR